MDNRTTEVFIEEQRDALNNGYKAEPVVRRWKTDEVMTLEEFNKYYSENENEENHIIIF